jgi:membrane protein required for beta-lactamase induction
MKFGKKTFLHKKINVVGRRDNRTAKEKWKDFLDFEKKKGEEMEKRKAYIKLSLIGLSILIVLSIIFIPMIIIGIHYGVIGVLIWIVFLIVSFCIGVGILD